MEFLSGAIVSEIRTRTLASPVPTIVGIVWANYGNLIIINTSPGMNKHIKKITITLFIIRQNGTMKHVPVGTGFTFAPSKQKAIFKFYNPYNRNNINN